MPVSSTLNSTLLFCLVSGSGLQKRKRAKRVTKGRGRWVTNMFSICPVKKKGAAWHIRNGKGVDRGREGPVPEDTRVGDCGGPKEGQVKPQVPESWCTVRQSLQGRNSYPLIFLRARGLQGTA